MNLLCLAETVRYIPFRDPMWGGWNVWPLLLLPLCAGIAIAYKGIRVGNISELPRVATRWFLIMVGSLLGLALALFAVLRLVEI